MAGKIFFNSLDRNEAVQLRTVFPLWVFVCFVLLEGSGVLKKNLVKEAHVISTVGLKVLRVSDDQRAGELAGWVTVIPGLERCQELAWAANMHSAYIVLSLPLP